MTSRTKSYKNHHILGGRDDDGEASDDILHYNVTGDEWMIHGSMQLPRISHAVSVLSLYEMYSYWEHCVNGSIIVF